MPPQLKIRLATGLVNEVQAPFAYTYEEQFIMRFPQSLAPLLAQEVNEGGMPKDMAITFTSHRRATIKFHEHSLLGVLLDLPSIVESYKTIDRSQYYKIADISQILLVLPNTPDSVELIKSYEEGSCGNEGGRNSSAEIEKLLLDSWQFPHGLTPPLRNIRQRRLRAGGTRGVFSLTQQKKVEAIERKVQQMLDRDSLAVKSSFVVYDANGQAVMRGGETGGGTFERITPSVNAELPVNEEVVVSEEEREDEIESDVDDFAAELEEEMLMAEEVPAKSTESTLEITESPSIEPEKETPILSPAIVELQTRIEERKRQLASVTNPLIKARLEDVIRQLENDLQSRLS